MALPVKENDRLLLEKHRKEMKAKSSHRIASIYSYLDFFVCGEIVMLRHPPRGP